MVKCDGGASSDRDVDVTTVCGSLTLYLLCRYDGKSRSSELGCGVSAMAGFWDGCAIEARCSFGPVCGSVTAGCHVPAGSLTSCELNVPIDTLAIEDGGVWARGAYATDRTVGCLAVPSCPLGCA